MNNYRILIDISTSGVWGRSLIRGFVRYSDIYGPWLLSFRYPYYLTGHKSLLSWVKTSKPDGVIMLQPRQSDIPGLLETGVPIIVSGYDREIYPDFANLITDHIAIGDMAAQYLLERKFRTFAFCGYDDFFWSSLRGKGFCDSLRYHGCEAICYSQPQSRRQKFWENEQFVLAKWLKGLPKPAGLFACIDDRAAQVSEACKLAGLRIPEDIAILGVNNDELICSLPKQSLSSVAINAEKAGFEAARLMADMIGGKTQMKDRLIIVSPTHIVTRESTDTIAIEDEQLRKAINFMRQNAKSPIQVADVVAATKESKRTLQKKFHNILGSSINAELTRIRISMIKQLLMETSLSVSDIAGVSGFTSREHISRYFRKQTGISCSDFRKTNLIRPAASENG